jgi:DDE superfamily endonuclease
VFGIGRGTVEVYKRRCTAAISSLRNEAIQWPNVAERKEIALRMMLEHDFINCIGIADGTLFPLTYEPRSKDAPDYHGRKFRYSLSVMIINDDKKRIRAYLSGFPGCAHDNRVYKAMDLAQNPQKYFGRFYYLVADSAFSNTSSVVSSFRKPAGASLTEEQEKFNTILGSLRVRSEHTIGILKARFPWLQSIPMIITDKVNSVRAILRVIDCCVILHNLLLDANDDVPQAWLDDLSDDASDIGEAVGEYEFAGNIRDNNSDERRQYILDYFRDQRLV